jgi:cysteine synthase A
MAFRIPDSESVPLVFELMRREGLCLGSSSGVNVAGAIRMARELGPGHTIVTILCDSGLRYLRRLYNPAVPALEGPPGAGLAGRRPDHRRGQRGAGRHHAMTARR